MKISNRDWIQLSAYLDGELSRREMEQLRSRIEADPDLQTVLEELKTTKDILRKTPEIHVPRNFTLSPTQVGIRSRRPVYRKYQLAAALMSFMLIGVLVLDFGRIFMGGAFAPAAPMAEEIMMEKGVEDSLDVPLEEPSLLSAEAEGDSARASAEEEATSEVEEEFAEVAAAPETEPEEGMVEEEAPAAEAEVQAVEVAGAPAVSEGVQAVDEVGAPAGTQVGETKSAGEETHEEVMAADQGDGADQANLVSPTGTPLPTPYPTQSPTYYEEPVVWEAPRRLINPFRVLETIFFVGLLGFGITAWVLRKRDSR